MSVAVLSVQQYFIPVDDERLNFPPDATKDHRAKINAYNELLEEAFHRELELAKLKASLSDLRHEIVEEAQTLDPKGAVISASSLHAGESASEPANGEVSSSGDEAVDSDSASGEDNAIASEANAAKAKSKKRRGSKGKAKGRGKESTRREEIGVNWDYNLNVAGGLRALLAADED